ncbi:Tenascin-like protein [Giardia duodenalis]|uniref:Tenascin-like protein n=2 Tax=Giardia intestinalis TaxID=5741 RepID=A8BZA2_GIAIC|nr:Tenascin-like protein [Giardia intestinalis]KAE8304598.1 Tenascin-like protein [Giardia intestinalis]QYO48060.1 tenascin-like [Giardia intestinalis]|eukprot:XP_001704061.1 Tenascin-like [Giardia lamblia ATCC 50803]
MIAAAFLCFSLAIVCPDGEVDVNGTCYPETCVFEDAVCNGHGSCREGTCNCEDDYLLTELGCYPSGCSDRRTQYVCGRHGSCTLKGELYSCDCMDGYINLGSDCIHPFCMVDYSVCSYYGDCVYDENDQPHCRCDKVATGEHCEKCSDIATEYEGRCVPNECLSERSDGKLVECGGFGLCYGLPPLGDESACLCDFGTVNVDLLCIPATCMSAENPNVFCSSHGYCDETRKCICDDGYDGDVCQYKVFECEDGYVYSEGQCVKDTCVAQDGHVCAKHGSCKTESCVCDPGYVLIGTAECTPAVCLVGGEVCPHGECTVFMNQSYCKCDAEYTAFENKCIPNSCISATFDYGYPELCSNKGTCDMDKRRCVCNPLYGGTYCQKCSEDALAMEDGSCVSLNCISTGPDGKSVVCSDHGTCTAYRESSDPADVTYICQCKFGYTQLDSSTCVSDTCISDDVAFKECNGNGVCQDGECKCNKGFHGDFCGDYDCPSGETYVLSWGCMPDECVTEYEDGKRRVCSGYGRCVKKGNAHVCECRRDGTLIGNDCVSPECLTDDGKVCYGTGACRDGRCV